MLTLAYANARGGRSARARPASCTSGAARATSCGTRARRRGNTQRVRALRLDCDGDALLALVEPAGPACHTGERTCFHHGELEPPAPHEALPGARAHARRRARPSGPRAPTPSSCSTTRRCIGEKVQEEAEEVARAAREETDERVDEEAADVLYHLAVLLHARGRALADAEEVLNGRRR